MSSPEPIQETFNLVPFVPVPIFPNNTNTGSIVIGIRQTLNKSLNRSENETAIFT